VPDRVLTTLIKNLHADPFFTTFPTHARRKRSNRFRRLDGRHASAGVDADFGFATLAATCLASLANPLSDPLIMFRVRALAPRRIQLRPVTGMPHMRRCWIRSPWSTTPRHGSTSFEFIVDRSINQAITTQAPVALILSRF